MAEKTCAVVDGGRGYCGRRSRPTTKNWASVTCEDCHAAYRADNPRSTRGTR